MMLEEICIFCGQKRFYIKRWYLVIPERRATLFTKLSN